MERDDALHLFGTAPGELLPEGQVHSTMDNSLSSGTTSKHMQPNQRIKTDSFCWLQTMCFNQCFAMDLPEWI
jgi:hypothetical protein